MDIDRRDVLKGVGIAGMTSIAPLLQQGEKEPDNRVGASVRASTYSRVTGRQGVLVGLEGLICFGLVKNSSSNLGVDALIVNAIKNTSLGLHTHVPVMAAPRDLISMGVEGAVAVDLDYAYFPLLGRNVVIEQISPSSKNGPSFDTNSKLGDPTQKDWNSTGWLASLDEIYAGYEKIESLRQSDALSSIVRFVNHAEFEPADLVHGLDDKPNGLWRLVKEVKGNPVEVRGPSAYKHSVHVFYQGAAGIRVSGLLPRNAKLEIGMSTNIPRPVRILSLPARAATREELARMKDARAYAELLKSVPITERPYPVFEREPGFRRTDSCGCCPMFRFVEEATALPPI